MLTKTEKDAFRRACALAQTDTLLPGWTESADATTTDDYVQLWYERRMRDGDFTKIVEHARYALTQCDKLTNVEQVRALVRAEIEFMNVSMVASVLLHDIAPLRNLLLTDPMNMDEYRQQLQLVIEAFSADAG